MQIIDTPAMREFHKGIHSEHTLETYNRNLSYFIKYIKMPDSKFLKLDPKKQYVLISTYIAYLQKQGLAPNTVRSRYAVIKKFLYRNDITLNWDKLSDELPKVSVTRERLPSKEEIKSLYHNLRARGRALLKFLLETGCRIEGTSELTLDCFEPIDKEICKVIVYRDSPNPYETFCSMDVFEEIKKLPEPKASANSKAYQNKKRDKKVKYIFPYVGGCRAILRRGWKRAKIELDFPSNHFARKYFKTNGERSGVKSIFVEACMGHYQGLDKHYFRENFDDLLSAYKQILPYLSLDGNGVKQIQESRTEINELKTAFEALKRDFVGQNAAFGTLLAYLKAKEPKLYGKITSSEPKDLAHEIDEHWVKEEEK